MIFLGFPFARKKNYRTFAVPSEYGAISSVGRAPDCGSGCRGFEPHIAPPSKRPPSSGGFFAWGRERFRSPLHPPGGRGKGFPRTPCGVPLRSALRASEMRFYPPVLLGARRLDPQQRLEVFLLLGVQPLDPQHHPGTSVGRATGNGDTYTKKNAGSRRFLQKSPVNYLTSFFAWRSRALDGTGSPLKDLRYQRTVQLSSSPGCKVV